jgi:hypothetical protein
MLAAGAGVEDPAAPRAIMPLQLEPVEAQAIALNQDRIRLPDPDGGRPREVKVALVGTRYCGRMLEVGQARAKQWPDTLLCYELRPTQLTTAYTWAIWAPRVLAHFRLFGTDGADNYLAWVEGSAVAFADVSKPRDRCVALGEHYTKRGRGQVEVVPLHRLVPQVHDWGVNALYCDINIRSIHKDDQANWVVKISPPDSEEVITLIGKGETWRRE